MKYKVTYITPITSAVLPYHWEEGSDRLEWNSPSPGMRAATEEVIANGDLDRYVGPHDLITRDGVSTTVVTIFNTQAGAQKYEAVIRANNEGTEQNYTLTIEEFPDA